MDKIKKIQHAICKKYYKIEVFLEKYSNFLENLEYISGIFSLDTTPFPILTQHFKSS